MTKRIYFYSILFLTVLSGFGQKVNSQKFSVKDGLCQSTVKQIEQDDFGNLWLATNYGLSKFNGKSFETYSTNNGLPSNDITCLFYKNEKLFIGTRKGFCFFNGDKIENTPLFQKIQGNVKKILERNNILHIITNKGYYVLDISKNISHLDSIPMLNVTSQNPTDAELDSDGNLWISTSKKGLFFIELSISTKLPKLVLIQNSIASSTINNKLVRIANFNNNNLLKGNSITSIEFDKQNNLFISDFGNGIARIDFDKRTDNGSFEAEYLHFDSINTNFIEVSRFPNIYKDPEGNLFLATDGFGFIKVPLDKNTNELDFSRNGLIWENSSTGFFGNHPLCFKQDKTNTWIGTLNDGLVLLNDKSSLSYNQKSGLLEEKVISVFKSKDSAFWLGTYGGGAFKFENKKFTRSFWEQGITESIIKSIAEDNFGNIWLGTMGGGISIIGKENTKNTLQVSKAISETNNLVSNFVSYIFKARNGDMWIGYQAQNKIDRITINKDLSYTMNTFYINDLLNFNVTCLLEDDNNNIWITSNEGVWLLNPTTGHVDNEFALFKNIQTIAKDWNGNMWLGSSDVGIIILKNKIKVHYFESNSTASPERITIENGISSNCVNSILFSKEAIWCVTNNGLNEIAFDSYLNKIIDIKNLNKGSSFASYDNKPNASILDNQENIWIGSIEGLSQYQVANKERITKTATNINVFINSIRIDNKMVDWTDDALFSEGYLSGVKFDGFFNWYKIPKNLQLDYTHNTIQLFLNTDYISDQKQINYAHKLIGFDKEWNTLFNTNEIVYRNLPAGDYSMLIKASLSNDFDNCKEFTYNFTINPPFWNATWFYLLVTVIVISSLYFLIVGREKRMKRERIKLELLVKSRTSEIENKKREIEIQNTLIQGINNDLTDSIKYAQRIQQTILPNTIHLESYFAEHFIYYQPRNIVSGDYYWIKEIDNLVYVAVVDCTGHGVPGAFMSLISSNILNEFVNISTSHSPTKIIEFLRKEIKVRLNENRDEMVNDGLDIALICFNKQNSTIEYVNANRPLYIISNDELITLASENVSIGGYADLDAVIPSKKLSIKKDDLLFLFTDGITDQFGGDKNKKYNPQRLRQFLLMNNHLPMVELRQKLMIEIAIWQSNYEQTDDILFIGLKI